MNSMLILGGCLILLMIASCRAGSLPKYSRRRKRRNWCLLIVIGFFFFLQWTRQFKEESMVDPTLELGAPIAIIIGVGGLFFFIGRMLLKRKQRTLINRTAIKRLNTSPH